MLPQWLVRTLLIAVLLVTSVTLSACEAIGDIFEAGVWIGALMIVFVVAIIGFIAAKLRS